MKTRIIHTRFWDDNYISTLNHKEKLLFLFLITNNHVNLSGIYELPDKYIKIAVDLTQLELDNIKDKFQQNNKLVFINGWIKIVNIEKYNNFTGEKNEIAKAKELAQIPKQMIEYRYPIDTPSIPLVINNKKSIINNHNKKSVISNLTNIDFTDIAERYRVPLSFVISKYDDMVNWHNENPKRNNKKDWKATLMNWVKRDAIKIVNNKKGGFVDATNI